MRRTEGDMSPWADCPIVEVQRDRAVGLIAFAPPFRGDRETAAVANTLAGLLAFADARGGELPGVFPVIDDAVTQDLAVLVTTAASVFYRHHKARRGMVCKKCGHPT
jgi:hypothetical protein